MIMHAGYNLVTGEIVECSNGNYLKKRIKQINHYDKVYFCTALPNKWIFAHGANALEKVCKKAQNYFTV